ncbi:MAG: GTPase ObgE [Candidatus Krumholzibacteria bacterium]|jgi:GTP-binding protein|nr:GTPase ObgE [Candidatus Krumholzibacteria bacterium]MDP6796578.1 GTPase ObgE [Candidatus Krumholzibacteria bacterium]MDP7020758.1 GTPase ObgE [Candidatus Krumholzibacteria bacterium]
MFIDRVMIRIASGKGGDGCVAFRRERFIPRGGPWGGDGGRGGSVTLRVSRKLNTLLDLRYRNFYQADKGKSGGSSHKTGRSGEDLVILVPPGTLVRDAEEDEILGDLTEEGDELLVAEGGKGGAGNARFKTASRQTPDFAKDGKPGEEKTLELELKLIADVGLVGFPNAGKSTLLSVISAARPKIADYPFTTLEPNLGIVKTSEYRSLVMADIPGLIEGASDGKGLGKEFLRHIERTRVLLFLVDASVEDPVGEYLTLLVELEKHDAELLDKPRILCLTKTDLLSEDPPRPEGLKESVSFYSISSVARKGLDPLLRELDLHVNPPEENESPAIPPK